MFKFFKKHPPKEGEDREKLKKDLFDYQKVSVTFCAVLTAFALLCWTQPF